jgi:Lrp/AsnC family leucine-responsive transcriptional regulator
MVTGGRTALDDGDTRIIAALADDGRRSNRDVSRAVGLSERVVGQRIRRLRELDVMRVVAVVDMHAAGFESVVNVGVRVSGRAAEDVARDLARLPQVLSVLLMSGGNDIEIVVAARNHATLATLVETALNRIPGIETLSPSLRLRVLKVEAGMAPLVAPSGAALAFPPDSPLDETARGIVGQLWSDPQTTNQDIAKRLGSSETTVRGRIADLRARGVLRITAINNLRVGNDLVFAAVGIGVDPGQLDHVAEKVCALAEVRFAATVLGRCHLLTMIVTHTAAQLSSLVHTTIGRVRGVARVEAAQALRFIKHDYRWAPLQASSAVAQWAGPTATPHGR